MADPVTPAPTTPAPTTPAPTTPAPTTPAPTTPAPTTPAPTTPAPTETKAPSTILTETPPAAAPEDIKVTLPEGWQDNGLVKDFLPLAKEAKLTSEQAQKLVDLHISTVRKTQEQYREQMMKWAEEAKADKDLSVNFDQNIQVARRALDKFGSPGLRELLTSTGLGNHKDVIKFFASVGKLVSEDRLPGNGAADGATAEPSREDLLKQVYPNSPGMFQGK
jgi:hypothetical protein